MTSPNSNVAREQGAFAKHRDQVRGALQSYARASNDADFKVFFEANVRERLPLAYLDARVRHEALLPQCVDLQRLLDPNYAPTPGATGTDPGFLEDVPLRRVPSPRSGLLGLHFRGSGEPDRSRFLDPSPKPTAAPAEPQMVGP